MELLRGKSQMLDVQAICLLLFIIIIITAMFFLTRFLSVYFFISHMIKGIYSTYNIRTWSHWERGVTANLVPICS